MASVVSNTSSSQTSSDKLLKCLRKFSADRVKMESDGTKWANQMIEKYVKGQINLYFQEKANIKIKEFVFTGSAFEFLKTEAADEADIMIVLRVGKNDVTFDSVVPGYYRLRAKEGSVLADKKFVNDENFVLPEKLKSWFFGLVQKAIDDGRSLTSGEELKLSSHGPAVQLDICENGGGRKLSIDLVPAFNFTEQNEHLVAKTYPQKASKKPPCDPKLLWRRSFSAKEKALLNDMDKEDHGCRKELLRIVKTVIRREPTFSKLTSYHLKTAFLSYKLSTCSVGDWHRDKLALRFLGFLEYLHERLVEKILSHHWITEVNLLDGISEATLTNMKTRLHRVLNSEKERFKILSESSTTFTTLEAAVEKCCVSEQSGNSKPSNALLNGQQQQSGDLLKLLRKFSADRVKMESDGTKWANQMIEKYVKGQINLYFQEKANIKIKEFVFTGSAFEFLKTEAADEADIMIVLRVGKNDVTFDSVVPGYYRLRAKEGSVLADKKFVNDENFVLPEKLKSWFFGLVQKAIDDGRNGTSSEVLKLSSHGPAVQLDICENGGGRKLSIDLVPAFNFTEQNEHLVAKTYPQKASKKPPCDPKLLWRRSFSAKEKSLLNDMDKEDHGCRKELLRIVKTVIRREPTFSKLTSYHLKTAFLSYKISTCSVGDWHRDKLALRFLGFLEYLHERLVEKILSHHWIAEVNLLDGISEATLTNMETRLKRILSSEPERHKILSETIQKP